MFSALLAGALIVAASLLLGAAIMALAGLPRHFAAGPAAGISALLVICGIAVKLPGHAVTAAIAVGLALISRLAPAGTTSIMMGVWFAATLPADVLAGFLGGFWSSMAKTNFFLMIALIAAFASVALWAASHAVQKSEISNR